MNRHSFLAPESKKKEFSYDLRKAAERAAKTLRGSLDTSRKRTKWGLKLEAQMVAETYHILRNRGKYYTPKNLNMEFHYTVEPNKKKKKRILRPDIIFRGEGGKEQPVEFKVLHRTPIKRDSTLSQGARSKWEDGIEQAEEYWKYGNISKSIVIVAYLGPDPDDSFDLHLYKRMVSEFHKDYIEVIAC